MSREFEDKILLYQAKVKQNPESYGKLYDAYVKRIYRFVYFKVSNHEEAEDITSEVFLRAWNYLREGKEIKSFSGLLYRVARNCIIDLYRAKSTQAKTFNTEDVAEENDLADNEKWKEGIENKIETEKVLKALKNLKQEYQEVITLHYVDGLDVAEIAEIIDKGKIATRVTLHRALKKLKQILGN